MNFFPELIGLVAGEAAITFSHHDIFKSYVMWHICLKVETAFFKYVDQFCL
jgi:hypothetical protein